MFLVVVSKTGMTGRWVAVALVAAASLSGCAARHDVFAEHDRAWRRLPVETRRARIHGVLARYAEPHDVYGGSLGPLATEETVPLLLARFRADFGVQGPPPPPPRVRRATSLDGFPFLIPDEMLARPGAFVPAYPCVHFHLVDALARITNTDRGMYYPAWETWWQAHRHEPMRTWVMTGFADAGLHATDPLDDRFALELISLLQEGPDHLRFNARRLLLAATPAERRRWFAAAGASADPTIRRGAAAASTLTLSERGQLDAALHLRDSVRR